MNSHMRGDGLNFIYAALGLLALLVSAVWVAMKPAEAPQSMPPMPKIDVKDVVDIRIETIGMSVHLYRSDEQWLVDGSRADSELVERLLSDLAGMQPVRLLTRNVRRYGELGLAGDAVHLTLKDGKEKTLVEIDIGKQGTDILSTYIRFAGMDAAIAVNRTLVWQVRRSKQGWLAPEQPKDNGKLST